MVVIKRPGDDMIQLEVPRSKSGLHLPYTDPSALVRTRVLALGKGLQRVYSDGRYEMPCAVGDAVWVPPGAGLRYSEAGADYWFVFASHNDIIAVLQDDTEMEAAA